MDIRIECMAEDPPVWKVFLGTFFWSCNSEQEATQWADAAAQYMREQSSQKYRLPAPLPAGARPGQVEAHHSSTAQSTKLKDERSGLKSDCMTLPCRQVPST